MKTARSRRILKLQGTDEIEESELLRRTLLHHSYGLSKYWIFAVDVVAREWYGQDWDLPAEVSRLAELNLLGSKIIFDVGAHQGIIAMLLAELNGEGGEIIAVEAHPFNSFIAKKNVERNGFKTITVLNAAVDSVSGHASFIDDLNGALHNGIEEVKTFQVLSTTLDEMSALFGQPDIIFLDIEGAEVEALKGAKAILRRGKTDFLIEVHLKTGLEVLGGSLVELLSFFHENEFDFEVCLIPEKKFKKVTKESVFEIQERFFLLALSKRN